MRLLKSNGRSLFVPKNTLLSIGVSLPAAIDPCTRAFCHYFRVFVFGAINTISVSNLLQKKVFRKFDEFVHQQEGRVHPDVPPKQPLMLLQCINLNFAVQWNSYVRTHFVRADTDNQNILNLFMIYSSVASMTMQFFIGIINTLLPLALRFLFKRLCGGSLICCSGLLASMLWY